VISLLKIFDELNAIATYETLFNILLKISDIDDLLNLCSTNTAIKSICDDDYFWKLRFEQDYPNLSIRPSEGMTYKELYEKYYTTGFANRLIVPPVINQFMSVIYLIYPNPPYTIEDLFISKATQIGGDEYYILIPDIYIVNSKRLGYWLVFEYPREYNQDKRNNMLPNGQVKILRSLN